MLRSLGLLMAAPLLAAAGSISGVVVDGVSGEPVAKAQLHLTTFLDNKLHQSLAVSDASGRFRFDGLPAATYSLLATRTGYLALSYGADRSSQTGKQIYLKAGESTAEVSYRMLRAAQISGRVTTAEGDPLPRSDVQLLRLRYSRGRETWVLVKSALSDDRGEYRLKGLEAGQYRLLAWSNAIVSVPHFQSQIKPVRGMPRFYPNSETIAGASKISVAPGQQVRGADIQLPLQPSNTVRLRMSGLPQGVPVGYSVQMFHADSVPRPVSVLLMHQRGDELRIDDVAPGKYRLLIRASQGESSAEVLLTVGEEDMEVPVALSPAVSIAGNVIVEGEQSQASYRVKFASVEHPPKEAEAFGEKLSFTMKGVQPGVWDVGVEPMPENGYIKAMTLGGQDVLVDDMVITPQTAAPLKIVVSARGGRVAGTTDDSRRYLMVLAPWDHRRESWGFYYSEFSKQDGSFEMKRVAPGAYRLFALESSGGFPESTAYFDSIAEWGVPVTVKEADALTVKVVPVPSDKQRVDP